MADSRVNKLRKQKQALNKLKGKISDEAYQKRLIAYNSAMKTIHRDMVYRWREIQGLHTVKSR